MELFPGWNDLSQDERLILLVLAWHLTAMEKPDVQAAIIERVSGIFFPFYKLVEELVNKGFISKKERAGMGNDLLSLSGNAVCLMFQFSVDPENIRVKRRPILIDCVI